MREKKNIDRLFREKFKDFEAAPPEDLWGSIAEGLQEKKKSKTVPLWIRLSGVAAVLLLGLLLTIPFFNGGYDTNESTVIIDGSPEVTKRGEGTIEQKHAAEETTVSIDKPADESIIDKEKQGSFNEGIVQKDSYINHGKTHTAIVSGKTPNKGEKSGNEFKGQQKTDLDLYKGADKNIASGDEPGSIVKETILSREAKNQDNPVLSEKAISNSEGQIAETSDSAKEFNAQNHKNDSNYKLAGQELSNSSHTDKILASASVDTTKVVEENPLEKLLNEKENGEDEESVVADNAPTRWNIKPQIAPVFFNSLSEGSPIDAQFASNSKSYDNDLSYGVGVNYALTERLSVRSAVNRVNLSYSTNDIEFYASMSGHTNNVTAVQSNAANIVVQDVGAPMPASPTGASHFAASNLSNETFNGSMQQQMGYIEVPLELSYGLLKSRFGIEIIGGMSTLFLDENRVSVISDQGYMSDVGEASNLNNVSFTTNVGVGFKYRLLPQMEVNFEPTFKYQVNTFSQNPGNFKPYFIGLYSGVSFKF